MITDPDYVQYYPKVIVDSCAQDDEYYFVGEVDYHLLISDKPYEGLRSHREALIVVFDRLAENIKDIRERCGNDVADKLSPLI